MLPYIAFLSLCKFCLVPCFCIHSNPLIHLSSPLLCHNSKSEEFMTVTMVNTTLNIRMTCSHTHSVLRVNTFNICIGICNVLHWIHTPWHAASLSLSLSLQVLSFTLFLLLPQTLNGKSVLFILYYLYTVNVQWLGKSVASHESIEQPVHYIHHEHPFTFILGVVKWFR